MDVEAAEVGTPRGPMLLHAEHGSRRMWWSPDGLRVVERTGSGATLVTYPARQVWWFRQFRQECDVVELLQPDE